MENTSEKQVNQLLALASEALGSGRLGDALSLYQEILSIDPNSIAGLNNMGLVLLEQEEYDRAVKVFQRAIVLNPNIAPIHHNLGLAFHKLERIKEAIASYQRAVALDEEYNEPLQNLGAAYKRIGKLKEAADCYRRFLELVPGDKNAQYMLDAITGTDQEKSAPREFVTELFDGYAGRFEDQLVEKLAYHIPGQLNEAFTSYLGKSVQFESLLDLGCGTGLAGKAFHGTAQSLTGVDLSANMLEQAGVKRVYTRLYQAEIREFLETATDKYDIVLAADVLIYLGVLDDIFALVAGVMKQKGYFLFSTEDNPNPHGVSLLQSGRYGHGPVYVQSLALKYGFLSRLCRPARIRKEGDRWLDGNIHILEFLGRP